MPMGGEPAPTLEPTPSLSGKGKNKLTPLKDALIEQAKEVLRQRGVRTDLSEEALTHSLEKCRVHKSACAMTEAEWIETLVRWVSRERVIPPGTPTTSPIRWEPLAPEEKDAREAAFATRMAAADAQHQQRLERYRATQHDLRPAQRASQATDPPTDPRRALQALMAQVQARTKPSSPPRPPSSEPRTFGPVSTHPAHGSSTFQERRTVLNQLLRDMQEAGCSMDELAHVRQGVRDAPDSVWPAIIEQARRHLTQRGQEVT